MIIARIGVATLAIGQAIADRMIIVALEAQHAMLLEQGKDTIRMRTKGTEIAQAEHGIYAA